MPPRPTADPDEQAPRRAVCASPDDDLLRLVFADYLEERDRAGDGDRAGFIRAQCEMARAPYMSARWRALDKLERRLHAGHWQEWEQELPGPGDLFRRFERGFVGDVTVRARAFVESGDALFAVAPIQSVRVGHAQAGVGAVLAAPAAARVRRLDLRLAYDLNDLAPLAAAGHLPGLRGLTLPYSAYQRAGYAPGVAAAVRGLPGLEELALARYVGQVATADPVLEELAAEPAARRLVRLGLVAEAWVGDAGLTAVAGSPHLAGLVRLDLVNAGLAPGGVAPLAATRTLAALEILDLSGNRLADEDVRALGGAAFAPTLRVLVLRRCGLSRAGRKRFDGLFPRAEVVF